MAKPSTKQAELKRRKALERRRRLLGQRKRRANEAKWQLNGLVKPDPAQPKVGTKAFEKLRKQWYGKLAASEQAKVDATKSDAARKRAEAAKFTDIEWADNPDSRHVKLPASRGRKLVPGKQLYYALARNYLTHHNFKYPMERVAWKMHSDGLSYRKIHDYLVANHGLTKSIYWLFYYVKKTAAKCKKFNSTHAEGLLNPANQDSFASDVLIGDFRLQSADDQDSDYGMPIDTGFWENVPKPGK